MKFFKDHFNAKKAAGLFVGSLLLTTVSMVFDETRIHSENEELVDKATKKMADEMVKRLKEEGLLDKKENKE